jgi:hypothetical protein
VQQEFIVTDPDRLWLTDISEHPRVRAEIISAP